MKFRIAIVLNRQEAIGVLKSFFLSEREQKIGVLIEPEESQENNDSNFQYAVTFQRGF